MKVTVDEKAKMFHLVVRDEAANRISWYEQAGHGFTVGEYDFCATPNEEGLIISEISTGSRLMILPIDLSMLLSTDTKERFIDYLQSYGQRIAEFIKNKKDFAERIEEVRLFVHSQIGKPPQSYEIDTEGDKE